jgi:hypothetical protein
MNLWAEKKKGNMKDQQNLQLLPFGARRLGLKSWPRRFNRMRKKSETDSMSLN